MSVTDFDTTAAHRHCADNRDEVQASALCGCFYCEETFAPETVTLWCNEREGNSTALCPKCCVDSVLGSSAGYPLTPEFLAAMKKRWFSPSAVVWKPWA